MILKIPFCYALTLMGSAHKQGTVHLRKADWIIGSEGYQYTFDGTRSRRHCAYTRDLNIPEFGESLRNPKHPCIIDREGAQYRMQYYGDKVVIRLISGGWPIRQDEVGKYWHS